MKEKWLRIVDKYIMNAVIILYIPYTVFALWYQSGGFRYIKLTLSVFLIILGIILGYAILSYYRGVIRKSPENRKIMLRDFLPSTRTYILTFFLCGILTVVTNILWVTLLGALLTSLSGSVLLFFKWAERKERNEDGNN